MAEFEILSEEEVAQLHRNFEAALRQKAAEAWPAGGQLADKLVGLLRAAARKGREIKPEELARLAQGGDKAVQKRLAELGEALHAKAPKEQEYPSPGLSEEQQHEVEQAALVRREAPAIEALFGARERLYLRPKGEGVTATQREVAAYLAQQGYQVTDYVGGYATDASGKQQYKIGRLLKGADTLAERFERDPKRTMAGHLIVVSRNADDIANMSTARPWASCTGSGGFNWRYVPRDIEKGALIAYLVSENDPDILSPRARERILPFARSRGFSTGLSDLFRSKAQRAAAPMAFYPNTSYGLGNQVFRETVMSFVEALNENVRGKYRINEALYEDGIGDTLVRKKGRKVKVYSSTDW